MDLTCDGKLQYTQNFNEGDRHPLKPLLPAQCRALGDADVDRIIFRHMEGYYIRGIPKGVGKKEATIPNIKKFTTAPTTQTTTQTSTTTEDNNSLKAKSEYPTCNCWSAECDYCKNMECAIEQDLSNSEKGIQVTSKLNRRDLNSVVLYDKDGDEIGKFQWNMKGIRLTGCISCQTPARFRKARAESGPTTWDFSIKDGIVKISINSEVLYSNELQGECKERFSKVAKFAFYDMTCESTWTFRLSELMVAGDRVVPDCSGTCPIN